MILYFYGRALLTLATGRSGSRRVDGPNNRDDGRLRLYPARTRHSPQQPGLHKADRRARNELYQTLAPSLARYFFPNDRAALALIENEVRRFFEVLQPPVDSLTPFSGTVEYINVTSASPEMRDRDFADVINTGDTPSPPVAYCEAPDP